MMQTPASFTPSHFASGTVTDTSLAFAFSGTKLLVRGEEQAPRVPTVGELAHAHVDGIRHYVGRLDGADCVAILLPDGAAVPSQYAFASLRSLFPLLAESLLAVAGRAFQVIEWERTHRYCGRCGSLTQDRDDERAKQCPVCGYVAYPRVSPAMMVLVTRGRELLLARSHRFAGAVYSALAGFVEAGESIEDCIHREVREEVGVAVRDLRYFASQSWSFPHSLMIAFTAHYASGDLAADGSEIADVRWFDVDALPDLPSPMSIARHLIDTTAARLREAFPASSLR